jgi:hypothetical protein
MDSARGIPEEAEMKLSASLRWHYPNQVSGIISAPKGAPRAWCMGAKVLEFAK